MASCTALNKLGANKWGDLGHVARDLNNLFDSLFSASEYGTWYFGVWTLESLPNLLPDHILIPIVQFLL